MSGIFGILNLDGRPVEVGNLEHMRQSLAHRGPDGSNIWVDGPVGLGQLMLCSTEESLQEPLPWKHPASGLVITADARIDNRAELIRELGLHLDSGRNAPDSRLILASYLQWGETCVQRLLGDFAFAIWNPRTKTCFCARDHMGVRPFYYYHSGQTLVFASSAQAVVTATMVPERINEERVADFLVFSLEGVNNRCTFFKDVWRLPPAHTAAFSRKGFSQTRYWQPDPETEICLGSDDAYTDAFQDVLSKAVEARLRSHKPPASMLSGGIDSSTIVGLARNLLSRSPVTLRTCSGISDDTADCRESQNIIRVIAQGGTEPHLVRPSEVESFAAELDRISARIEDPFDSHCILMMLMYLSAAADGCVSVMDGLDGDGIASLTSIYPSYLVRDGLWFDANREIRGLWKNYYQLRSPRWRDYFDALKPALLPEFVLRKRWTAGFERMARNSVGASFFSPALARQVDVAARFGEFYSHTGARLEKTLRHAHAARVTVPYLTVAIERYARLAAYCGVEQRHPLLDKRVVEFCLGLPWHLKVRHGWSKYLLRRVAQRFVPDEVAWRQGWDAISWKFVEAWQDRERPALKALVQRELVSQSQYLDVSAVNKALQDEGPGKAYGEGGQNMFYLVRWLARQGRRSTEADDRNYWKVG